MKKFFFVLALVAGGFTASQAQVSAKFGGGINVALPTGNDNFSVGAGLDLMGHFGLSDKLALTADAGYTALFPKSDWKGSTYGLIPIRGGVRLYPSPAFFVGGKAGVGLLNYKLKRDGIEFKTENNSSFAYSFGAGYVMDSKLEIGASYDGYSQKEKVTDTKINNGMINVRLGYWFGNN